MRMEPAPIHRLDVESLQRGARNFVNYCLNCHTREVHALQPADGLGLTEAQIQRQPDVRDRQDRRDDDGRDDARRREGLVRRGAAGPDRRSARARRGLALQLFPRASTATTRRRPAGTTSCSRTSRMPHVLWSCRAPTGSCTTEFDRPREGAGRGDRGQGPRRCSSRGKDDKYVVQTIAAGRAGHADARSSTRRSSPTSSTSWTTWASPTKNQRISIGIVVLLYLGVLFVLRLLAEARVLEGRSLKAAPSARRAAALDPGCSACPRCIHGPDARQTARRVRYRARRTYP